MPRQYFLFELALVENLFFCRFKMFGVLRISVRRFSSSSWHRMPRGSRIQKQQTQDDVEFDSGDKSQIIKQRNYQYLLKVNSQIIFKSVKGFKFIT